MSINAQITDETSVYVITQGYYASGKTEILTFVDACRELVAHGAFRNTQEAREAVKAQILTIGRFKKASAAPGVNHPIVFLH